MYLLFLISMYISKQTKILGKKLEDRCQKAIADLFSYCDYEVVVGGYICANESLSVEDDYLICKGAALDYDEDSRFPIYECSL